MPDREQDISRLAAQAAAAAMKAVEEARKAGTIGSESTDRESNGSLMTRLKNMGFQVTENGEGAFYIDTENGYRLNIERTSLEKTGPLLQLEPGEDPSKVPLYFASATDRNGSPVPLDLDGESQVYCSEKILEGYVGQLAKEPELEEDLEEEIPPVDEDAPWPGEEDAPGPEEAPGPEPEQGTDGPSFKEDEYELHGAASWNRAGKSDAEKSFHDELNRALYMALGGAGKSDIEEMKASEGFTDDAAALGQSLYQTIRENRDLRKAAQAYALEAGIAGPGKVVTNVRLIYEDKRLEDQRPVNDIAFRLIVEPENNRQRSATNRERTRVDILSDSEREYWTRAINLSAECIMRGESHVDRLMNENNSLFRTLSEEEEAKKKERSDATGGPTFSDQETKSDEDRADRAERETDFSRRAGSSFGDGPKREKTEYVSFTVIDQTGEQQRIRAAVDPDESSIGLTAVPSDKNGNYKLAFQGAAHPVYTTDRLFSAREAVYLSNDVKSLIAKYVSASVAKTVNEYYSSPQENKAGICNIPEIAREQKEKYIQHVLSMDNGSCSKEQFRISSEANRSDAEALMKILGIRLNSDVWQPSVTADAVQGTDERTPVLHLDNVGSRGAAQIRSAVTGLGLSMDYDQTSGTVSMWLNETDRKPPKPGRWQTERQLTNTEFNQVALKLAEARIAADKAGRSPDGKRGFIVPEQEVWELVRNTVKPEQSKGFQSAAETEYSKKMAAVYLKAMGLNLGKRGVRDLEHYPMRSMRLQNMQLYEVPLMHDSSKTVFAVRAWQVTESQAARAESYMKTMGLYYTYDKDDHTFTVAYSPEGRPAFERRESYTAPDYSKLESAYKRAAANTIGSMEGRHLIRTSGYRSKGLRKYILKGFGMLKRTEAEMNSKGESDKKLPKKAEKQIVRNDRLFFYTLGYEKEITAVRDATLGKWEDLSQRAEAQIGRVGGNYIK